MYYRSHTIDKQTMFFHYEPCIESMGYLQRKALATIWAHSPDPVKEGKGPKQGPIGKPLQGDTFDQIPVQSLQGAGFTSRSHLAEATRTRLGSAFKLKVWGCTWRLQCSSFLVLLWFLARDYKVQVCKLLTFWAAFQGRGPFYILLVSR